MSEQQNVAANPSAPPPKPSRAKSQIMSGDLLNKCYSDTIEAKARGEKIGWATSQFPQEIPEALGLNIVYPENHSAAIAAKKLALPFLEYAEARHLNNDLCSYAKINIAYADLLDCDANNMPAPDFLLLANNGCNEITKWFEIIAEKFNIPIFMVDMTYNHSPSVTDARVKYIRAQLDELIKNLSAFTGKTWDEDRYLEVQRTSVLNKNLWYKIGDFFKLKPAPISGFDLFNYMGPMVFCRGKTATTDVLEQLIAELEEHVKNGTSTFPVKEEFRIFWEGIACFPFMSHNMKTLRKHGINLIAASYARAWGFDYDAGDIDQMCRVYSFNSSNNILIDETIKRRTEWNKAFSIDGSVYHLNRACKVMSCQQQLVMREVSERCGGLPYVAFDGDQADPRNYSEAQFETRIEAFVELMRKHKEGK